MKSKEKSVQKSDFKNIRYIGSGAFGEVILVKKISDEQIYAMKRLDKRFIDKVGLFHYIKYIQHDYCSLFNVKSKVKSITSFLKS